VHGVEAAGEQPKNLICNFRAPSLEQFQRWKTFVGWAKDNGMDVCHLTLSLVDAFLSGVSLLSFVRLGRRSRFRCRTVSLSG